VRHESGDEGNKRTPDKISKFWSNYWHHSPKKQPNQQPKVRTIKTGEKGIFLSCLVGTENSSHRRQGNLV
jgi:hypothetical protein